MEKTYISDIAFSDAVKKRQEENGSRRIYENMAKKRDWDNTISEQLKGFIKERDSFYMASANAEGQPYIQHRGGPKGFLKVVDDRHLAFADFSGNRQYISTGNFDDNPKVHLFLMDYPNRTRIKIWGEARIVPATDDLIELVKDPEYNVPIERIIKIKVTAWNANCPQHIKERYTLEDMDPKLQFLRQKINLLEKQIETLESRQ
ncbi:pyridoxamine 5'-phosphate oxidase family protein [Seonamhaeicola marinus]|uniref:Pyridoxamine 5'-phosphate oxidase family protein n=1 Tax=Seonamhaeicola marinus TaxID=1912246 RepID=A0A5D0HTW0_9FLAO|nr:pyridoxamine 5'-phosphate oxidase family protein [Seonamhaeicola marinus]TYA74748.1 pyridoxamine 5'-phosphate oxidase family protein [Seonamhaeicola marinus]